MNHRPPLVSVVTASRNGARTLQQCLMCVEGQTVVDVEHIVVDDGSTDDSWDVIQQHAGPNVRAVRLPENRERAVARNVGISLAKGEIIAFIDADDTWDPRKLELQLERFEADDSLHVLGTGYVDGRTNRAVAVPLTHESIASKLVLQCPLAFSSVAVRLRGHAGQLLHFEHEWVPAEDFALWQRLAHLQDQLSIRFASIAEPLMTYGFTPNRPSIEFSRHSEAAAAVRRRVIGSLTGSAPLDVLDLAVGNVPPEPATADRRRDAVKLLRLARRRAPSADTRMGIQRQLERLTSG